MSANTNEDAPWRAEDLGKPIPDSPHALSVSLPLWEHNVGYEEGDPNVIDRMQAGYPRFFINPLVRQLHDGISNSCGGDQICFAFPSKATAARCVEYAASKGRQHLVTDSIHENVWFVLGSPDDADVLKQFWQHGGEILSSRAAEVALAGHNPSISDCDSKREIRQRVAEFNDCDANDVFLFPSGMASIYCAWRVCSRFRPRHRSVQFGFPYVDTLKLQERFVADGVRFLPNGDESELAELQSILQREQIQALYCEAPTNPLLVTPDLIRLRQLADQHHFPIVVDDTIGSLINCDTLSHCDLMTTSLTKFFSGHGDVMCGALTINSRSQHAAQLRTLLLDEYEDLFFDVDADVLAKNSTDASERVQQINRTAESVADFLHAHPAVDRLFYPKFTSRQTYDAIRKNDGSPGFGGLLSMTLKQSDKAPIFYDALQIAKGPNLGTNFSLCCPYTILAHYDELPFVESCGVSRNLIRVSIGLEDADWLVSRFEQAFEAIAS